MARIHGKRDRGHRSLATDGGLDRDTAREVQRLLPKLTAEVRTEPPAPPSPSELWHQAEGDKSKYIELMVKHGHLIRAKRPPGEDIFGHRKR